MRCLPNANFVWRARQAFIWLINKIIFVVDIIFFCRNQEVDKTLIRGEKLCKYIIGLDGFDILVTIQDMPVGKFIVQS